MAILALALILDWYVGDPDFVWKRVPHPVVWIGKLIDSADRMRYRSGFAALFGDDADKSDLIQGTGLVVVLFIASIVASSLIWWIAGFLGPFYWLVEILIVGVMVAQKSLFDHVQAVVDGLKNGGIAQGRQAVSMIVGRDVSALDNSGVSKAAIESLAENYSDGIVAPAFFYAVFGLPGIFFYKAINTADSMIGHRNVKYEFYGKAAAVTDDVLNWIPARLTAALVCLVTMMTEGLTRASDVGNTILRDGPVHRSPNAGWPETAFAASLGIALGGPRRYGDDEVAAPYLNASGRQSVSTRDIAAALVLFRRCCFLMIGLCIAVWFIF